MTLACLKHSTKSFWINIDCRTRLSQLRRKSKDKIWPEREWIEDSARGQCFVGDNLWRRFFSVKRNTMVVAQLVGQMLVETRYLGFVSHPYFISLNLMIQNASKIQKRWITKKERFRSQHPEGQVFSKLRLSIEDEVGSVTRFVDCMFNVWSFAVLKICPKVHKICQRELKILSNIKWTLSKWPKFFNIVPNFAKSGHTGSRWHN